MTRVNRVRSANRARRKQRHASNSPPSFSKRPPEAELLDATPTERNDDQYTKPKNFHCVRRRSDAAYLFDEFEVPTVDC